MDTALEDLRVRAIVACARNNIPGTIKARPDPTRTPDPDGHDPLLALAGMHSLAFDAFDAPCAVSGPAPLARAGTLSRRDGRPSAALVALPHGVGTFHERDRDRLRCDHDGSAGVSALRTVVALRGLVALRTVALRDGCAVARAVRAANALRRTATSAAVYAWDWYSGCLVLSNCAMMARAIVRTAFGVIVRFSADDSARAVAFGVIVLAIVALPFRLRRTHAVRTTRLPYHDYSCAGQWLKRVLLV